MQKTTLSPGQQLTVSIDRLSLGGDGVARADQCVVFVPYVCPGDRVEIEITEARKNFARGRLLRVLEASPYRTEPPCPYHFRTEDSGLRTQHELNKNFLSPQSSALSPGLWCGGCDWQHISYAGQLEAKRTLVQETLERLAGLRGIAVNPTRGMADPWRYRNKVQQPVGWDGRQLISGFYTPASHRIMPIEDCRVQPELSVAVLNRARSLLNQYHVQAYDERTRRGWIRHLLIRTAGNHALLVFVTRTDDFPHERPILETLIREFPGLVGIHQNVNPGQTNVILGRHWRKLAGADVLEERLKDLRFLVSPGSFFQINTKQTEVLYSIVEAMTGPGDLLLDLYSGVGTIALWLARQFQDVIGIEENRLATHDAENNARLNGIENVRFLSHETGDFVSRFQASRPDELVVVLDPPRAGCSPETVNGLVDLRPKKIVYVSCDPATLARDVGMLVKGGFHVVEVQPVDLFPQTAHIETALHLQRG